MLRLIRKVTHPGDSGPWNGQYALQRALRARGCDWLAIGGRLRDDDVAWIWCWKDRDVAAALAAVGRPLVLGPNVLFENSRRPCGLAVERELCDAASCRLMCTESAWYAELIEQHRGPRNRAPIVVWPYPIEPKPGGPLPARHDLLIYAKSGHDPSLIERLTRAMPRSIVLRYGQFRREELYEAARWSRCCAYLSDDDRGPLALAEILLAGCPTVGVPRGAPFIAPGRTGVYVERFEPETLLAAIERCAVLQRESVARAAAEQFDTERIVDVVLRSLAMAHGGHAR
jgi:hypothetical protein